MRKKYYLTSIMLSLLVALSIIGSDQTPYFAATYTELNEATVEADKIKEENFSDELHQATSLLQVRFLKNTSFVYSKGDTYYTSQGQYYLLADEQLVIYCLDPTLMAGDLVEFADIQTANRHFFNELSSSAQIDVLTIAYAANELYNSTGDEMYILLGQLGVWIAAGVDVSYVGFDYQTKYAEVIELAETFKPSYEQILADTQFLDTKGQDLVLLKNAPDMDLELTDAIVPPVDTNENQAPVINSEDILIQTDAHRATGESLITEEQLSDDYFGLTALDAEDGDISNNIQIDKTNIDPNNFGVYQVQVSVTDSEGLTATETINYVICSANATINDNTLIDGENLILTMDDINYYSENIDAYQEKANIHAFDFETNQYIDVETTHAGTDDDIVYYEHLDASHRTMIIYTENVASNQKASKSLFNLELPVVIPDTESLGETLIANSNPAIVEIGGEVDVNDFNLQAIQAGTLAPITDAEYDLSQVDTNIVGIYPVNITFNHNEDAFTKAERVIVVDEYTSISDDHQLFVHGSDIYTNEVTLSSVTSINDFILTEADAFAYDLTVTSLGGGHPVDVTVTTTNLETTNPPGVYTATLSASTPIHTVDREISIYVASEGDVIPFDSPYIMGNNVVVNAGDTIDNQSYNAYAFDRVDGDITENIVYPTVDTQNFIVSNEVLQVTNSNNQTASRDVVVTVLDQGSVISPSNELVLNADDILSNQDTLQSYATVEEFIFDLANVSAYSLLDGTEVSYYLDTTTLELASTPGIYTATISASMWDETITRDISIYLASGSDIIDETKPYINATNVVTEVNDPVLDIEYAAYAFDVTHGDLTSNIVYPTVDVTTAGVTNYDLTVSNSNGNTSTKTVTVTVTDSDSVVDESLGVFLYATDFMTNELEISSLVNSRAQTVNEFVIQNSNAKAYDIYTGAPVAIEVTNNEITNSSTEGLYNFTLNASGLGKTNVVTIDDATLVISANDIYTNEVAVSEYVGTLDNFIINNSSMTVHEPIAGSMTDSGIKSTTFSMTSQKGVYQAELFATNGIEEVTQIIDIVVASEAEIIDDTAPYITADNIVVNQFDIVSNPSYNAYAYDKQDGEITQSITYPTVDTSAVGSYVATLSSTDSNGNTTSIDVVVTVVGSDSVVSSNNEVFLDATNFSIDEVTLFNAPSVNDLILTSSSATAFDMTNGDVLTPTIFTTNVTNDSVPGSYTATIQATGVNESVSKQINIMVTGVTIVLAADDVYTNEEELATYDGTVEEFIIERSNFTYGILLARNTSTNKGNGIGNAGVDKTNLSKNSKKGAYQAVLFAENDKHKQEIVVDVYVASGNDLIDDETPYISASNVIVNVGDHIDNALYEANAFDRQDGDLSKHVSYPKIFTQDFGVTTETLSVTDSDHNKSTTDVVVAVVGEDSVVEQDKLLIDATDIYTNQQTLSSATNINDFIITNSNAKAYELTNGSELDIVISATDIAITSNPGIYNATLSATHDTYTVEKTITIVVANGEDVISDRVPYIYAEPVSIEKGATFDNSMFNAYAFDTIDGDISLDIVYPTIDTSQIGINKVTLQVTNSRGFSSSIQVVVLVTDATISVSPDGEVAVRALDFTSDQLAISNAEDLDQYLLEESEATGYDLTQAELLPVTIVQSDVTPTSAEGQYYVTVGTTNGVSSTTYTFIVSIKGVNVTVHADDIYTNEQELADYKLNGGTIDEFLETQSNLVMFDAINSGTVEFSVKETDLTLNSTEGVYQAVLSGSNGFHEAARSINIFVAHEQEEISQTHPYLFAKDVVIASGSVFDTALFEATAFDVKDGDITEFIDYPSVDTSTPGVYSYTLSAQNSAGNVTEREVSVTVRDKHTVIDPGGNVYLRAHDFTTDELTVSRLTDVNEFILTNSNAKAQVMDDASELVVEVVETTLTADSRPEGSPYVAKLRTTYGDIVVEKTISIIVAPAALEIEAGDIYSNEDTIASVVDLNEFIINSSNMNVSQTVVDDSLEYGVKTTDVEASVGSYQAILFAKNDLNEVTYMINIYVANDSDILDDELPYIYSDNVIVQKDTLFNKSLFNAYATDKQDGDLTASIVYPTVDTSAFGVTDYQLTVIDQDNNVATSNSIVTILGDETVISEDQEVVLDASDIYTNQAELSTFTTTSEAITSLSNASAYTTYDGMQHQVMVTTTNLKLTSIPGVYQATLVAEHNENAVEKTISIYVSGDDTTIDSEIPYISASNFKVQAGTEVTNNLFKATAFDVQDGDLTDSIVYPTVITDEVGVFKHTLTITDSDLNTSSYDVYITVYDEDVVISPDNKTMLHAEHFVTDEIDISYYDQVSLNEYILDKSDAQAFDLATGNLISTEVTVTDLTPTSKFGFYYATISTVDGATNLSQDIAIDVIESQIGINSNTIYTNIDTLSTYPATVDEFIVEYGQVSSVESIAGSIISEGIKTTDLTKEASVGKYTAVYEVSSNIDTVSEEIKIYVADGSDVVDDHTPYLYAENAIINAGEFVTNETINAKAYDKVDGNLTTSIKHPSFNSGLPGVYEYTISVTDSKANTASTTVYITVVDETTTITDNQELMIYGNDITIYEHDLRVVESINSMILSSSEVVAKSTIDGQTKPVSVKGTNLSKLAKPGVYSATVYAADGKNTVEHDIEITILSSDFTLEASDIITNEATLLGYEMVVENFILANADLTIVEDQVGSINKTGVKDTTLALNSSYGTYQATIYAENNAYHHETVITISVLRDDEVITTDSIPYITSSDVVLNVGDTYDNSIFEAYAYDVADGDITDKIVYPVIDTSKFSIANRNLSVRDSAGNQAITTSLVTVVDETTEIVAGEVVLDASDIYTNEDTLALYPTVDELIIDLSNAYAYDLTTKLPVDVVVDSTTLTLTSSYDTYQATLSAANTNGVAVSKSINIYVVQDSLGFDNDAPTLFADNFSIVNGQEITNEMFEAYAVDKQDGDITHLIKYPTIDTNGSGPYLVSLSVTDSDGNTVKTNVVIPILDEEADVDENDNVSVFAHDFTTSELELAYLGSINEFILDKSDASGFDIENGVSLAPFVADTDLTLTSPAGVYTALITSDNGTDSVTKEITITVDSADVVVDANDVYTNVDTLTNYNQDVYAFIDEYAGFVAFGQAASGIVTKEYELGEFSLSSGIGAYEVTLRGVNALDRASTTITIYVANGSDVIANQSPYLYAENIVVNKGDTIDNASYNAYAFDRQDGDLTNLINYPTVQTNKVGVFSHNITVDDIDGNRTTVSVTITVIDDTSVVDPSNTLMLSASDFTTNEIEIAIPNIIDELIISSSNAQAYVMSDGTKVDVNVVSTTLTNSSLAGGNPYTATLSATYDGVTVEREITITVLEASLEIQADDIYTNVDTVTNASDLDAFVMSESNMVVVETIVDPSLTTSVLDNSLVASSGVYQATLSANNAVTSTTKMINIYVVDGSDVVDNESPYLYAEDVVVNTGDVVSNEMFNAYAFDKVDGDISSSIVYPVVDTSGFGINTYELSVADSNGNEVTHDSMVTVLDDDSVIDSNSKVALDASDFDTNTDTLAMHDDITQVILSLSNAQGYDMVTGNVLDVNVVSTNLTLSSRPGLYNATLMVTNGVDQVAKDIVIAVANGSDVIDGDNPYLYAEGIVVNQGDVVNNDSFMASAFDRQDGDLTTSIVYPLVETSVVGSSKVSLSVTDSDGNTTSINVNAVVAGSNSVVEGNLMLDANNIELDMLEVDGLNQSQLDSLILSKSNAVAYNVATGEMVDVEVHITDLKPGVSYGRYSAILRATDGTDIVSKQIVIDLLSDEIFIIANDIVTNEEVLSIQTDINQFIIQQSGATFVEGTPGTMTASGVKVTDLEKTSTYGDYTATIYATSLSGEFTQDINIAVAKGNAVIDNQMPYLVASDVEVQAGSVFDNSLFNAYAYDKEDGSLTSSIVYPTVDTSVAGISTVSLSVVDSHGNEAVTTVDVMVTDGNEVIESGLYIRAEDLYTNENTINAAADLDAYLIEATNGYAYDFVNDQELMIEVSTEIVKPVSAGAYTATLYAYNIVGLVSIDVNVFVAPGDEVITSMPYISVAPQVEFSRADDNSAVTKSSLGLVAFNENGDISDSIDLSVVDVSKTGVYDHTFVAYDVSGENSNSATTKIVVTDDSTVVVGDYLITGLSNMVINEQEASLITNSSLMQPYVDSQVIPNVFRISDGVDVSSEAVLVADAMADYEVINTRGEYVQKLSLTIDGEVLDVYTMLGVIPGDSVTTEAVHMSAVDVVFDRGADTSGYDARVDHKLFAYDAQRADVNFTTGSVVTSGIVNELVLVSGDDVVSSAEGDTFDIDFSYTSGLGVAFSTTAQVIIDMPQTQFEAKVNALNLDTTIRIDLHNYVTTGRDYKLLFYEGNIDNHNPEPHYEKFIPNSDMLSGSGMVEYNLAGSDLALKSDTSYAIKLAEIGSKDYLIEEIDYRSPSIDPGVDGIIYAPYDADNYSYITDVYELESIGYEEDPQPGRIDFERDNPNIYSNDLTVTKYHYTYRPFEGNYRLANDIDGIATQTDTRSDHLGGFGTDGFKPIGYSFGNSRAYSDGDVSGSPNGVGFSSGYDLAFSGHLDGNGYAINDIYIDRHEEVQNNQTNGQVALFGHVKDPNANGNNAAYYQQQPNIYDLTVNDIIIRAPHFYSVAGLVGTNQGIIDNVVMNSDIEGNRYVAGVVGINGPGTTNTYTNAGVITNVVYNGNVRNLYRETGDSNVSGTGGIVGLNGYRSVISYSQSHGTIAGDDNVGGVIGRNLGAYHSVFSTADVLLGSNSVGGIVGYNNSYLGGDPSDSEHQNRRMDSYSTGDLTYVGSISDGARGYGAYIGGHSGWLDGTMYSSWHSGHVESSGAVYNDRMAGLAFNGTIDGGITIGDYIESGSSPGSLYKAGYGGRSYYTPATSIIRGTGSYNGGGYAYEKSLGDLYLPSTWESMGSTVNGHFTYDRWSLDDVTYGYAPRLLDADGNIMVNQSLVPLDIDHSKAGSKERMIVPEFGGVIDITTVEDLAPSVGPGGVVKSSKRVDAIPTMTDEVVVEEATVVNSEVVDELVEEDVLVEAEEEVIVDTEEVVHEETSDSSGFIMEFNASGYDEFTPVGYDRPEYMFEYLFVLYFIAGGYFLKKMKQ